MTDQAYSIRAWGALAKRQESKWLFLVVALSAADAALILYFQSAKAALALSCAIALLVAVWYRPIAGFYVLLGLTLLLEQYDFAAFTPVTRQVPFFDNLGTAAGIGALPINSLEVLLVLVGTSLLLRKGLGLASREWRRNELALPVAAFLLCLGLWLLYGVLNGGAWKVALWELRALVYFCIVAVLLPQLITSATQVRSIMWVVAGVVGIKAAQGLWTYLVVFKGDPGKARAVTGHEDALFIATMLILCLALWLYQDPGRMRVFLTALTPLMLVTLVATNRRAAYAALAVGVVVLSGLTFSLPERRRLVSIMAAVLVLSVAFYAAAFWNDSGPLGRPLRAAKSIWYPESKTDIDSNYYRRAEEMNLMATVRQNAILGLGFGRQYLGAANLSRIGFSLRDYIPHNEILWIWVKMGTVGFWAFWVFVCNLLMRGCRVFRSVEEPRHKALAATVVVLVVMQLVVSWADLQLTFYRNMVFLGTFVGILAAVQSLEGGTADAPR